MTIEYKDSKRIVALSSDSSFDVDVTPNTSGTGSDGTTWSRNDTNAVTFTNNRLNINISGGSVDGASYDLGSSYVGGTWTLDYEFTFTTLTDGLGSYHAIMLSNTGSSANWTSTNINAIWAKLGAHPTVSNADNMWIGESENQALDSGQDGQIYPTNNQSFSTNQKYYARLTRVSDTQYKFGLYSDATRTALLSGTQLVTGTITASAITDLRYISFNNYNGTYLNTGACIGYFENIQFYNNASTVYGEPKPKPINVQDNSLLVEKDTARRYWFDARGADTTSSQSSFDNDSKIENGASQYDFVGQQFLSGHSLIGQSISSISFWLWNIGSGSTTGATYSYGVFDSNGNLKGDVFGTLNVSDITQASSYSGATKRTMTTSSPVTIEANDFIGIRTNQALTSTAYDIEIGSGGNGSIENNAQRVRGSAGSVTQDSHRDVAYEVIHATPAIWTMPPTYEDDFSSDSGYTFTSGNSISGGRLTAKPAGSLGFTKPLGFTMDNTFVVRVHGYEVQSGYSWSSSMSYYFGFSDTATNTAYNGGGNAWGFKIYNRSGSNSAINNVWTKVNGTKTGGGNSTVGENGTDLVVGTKYYIEMKKTGNTTGELRIYSDSDFTTLHSTAYITDSAMGNPTGLNHFALQGQTIGGTHIFKVDKIEIWNGVTSIN